MAELTHADLALRAMHWLVSRQKCLIAATEVEILESGRADAMGWTSHGVSHYVEVKAHRSDWLRELKVKRSRPNERFPWTGPGDRRWLLVLPGIVLDDAEVWPTWGWAEVRPNGIRIRRDAPWRPTDSDADDPLQTYYKRRELASLTLVARKGIAGNLGRMSIAGSGIETLVGSCCGGS
jgi:hypothetical protein